MKKKTVSLLLSLAMCLTMLPGQSVFAAETSTETETEAASESTANPFVKLFPRNPKVTV